MRFSVTMRSGFWKVFDSITRRYYGGYSSMREAQEAAQAFNDAELMAANNKAVLL